MSDGVIAPSLVGVDFGFRRRSGILPFIVLLIAIAAILYLAFQTDILDSLPAFLILDTWLR